MAQAAAGHHATFGELVTTQVSCWGWQEGVGVRVRLGDGNCYPLPNRGDGGCSEDKKQPGGELRIPRKWPWIEHMFNKHQLGGRVDGR